MWLYAYRLLCIPPLAVFCVDSCRAPRSDVYAHCSPSSVGITVSTLGEHCGSESQVESLFYASFF